MTYFLLECSDPPFHRFPPTIHVMHPVQPRSLAGNPALAVDTNVGEMRYTVLRGLAVAAAKAAPIHNALPHPVLPRGQQGRAPVLAAVAPLFPLPLLLPL